MTARVLMVQGTGSSAGKSLLVTALCRIFARRGLRVAPFKAQNMSNNAAVCDDGAEIGRSQALQAAAAGTPPRAEMNPILLKPEADSRSQLIVNGRRQRTMTAREYFRSKQELWPVVTAALDRLRRDFELVVIEGAGSPAELNLRDVEIVNMAVARYANAPVLLVGDIETGGVFAQLLGTLWLLRDEERALLKGLIVNKFRGDRSLFDSGRAMLEDRGGVPVLGVLPWIADLNLPEEDSQVLDRGNSPPDRAAGKIEIAVIRLPRIANFDDFTPLAREPSVSLRYVDSPSQLAGCSAAIIPGSKATVADLQWLKQHGFAESLARHAAAGMQVVGICGGYQILGRRLSDPDGIESSIRDTDGLNLLPIETRFDGDKQTHPVSGQILADPHCPGALGQEVRGYEIHLGKTKSDHPWLQLKRNDGSAVDDGSISENGRVWGCYLHGIFENDAFRRNWLATLDGGQSETLECDTLEYQAAFTRSLDRLADEVTTALDMDAVDDMISDVAV